MGIAQSPRMIIWAIPALISLSGCGEMAAKNDSNAKPQAALSQVGSGGRVSGSAIPAGSMGQDGAVDFGDDASKYSRDGECDDKRFSGAGMTQTPLLDSDVGHDATDCRAAYRQGRLAWGSETAASSKAYADSGVNHIQWGDDASKYARDGECDDKRFSGAGMTLTPLLDSDIQHDATDCRAAFAQGRLSLRE
jgi:hypothetical protein